MFCKGGGEPGGFQVEHAVARDEGFEGVEGLGDGGLDGEVGACWWGLLDFVNLKISL